MWQNCKCFSQIFTYTSPISIQLFWDKLDYCDLSAFTVYIVFDCSVKLSVTFFILQSWTAVIRYYGAKCQAIENAYQDWYF